MGQINHLLNTAVPVTMVLLIVEEEQDRLGLEAVTILKKQKHMLLLCKLGK